ncbi:MAG: SEC-C domain-containing protein [Chloroflexota bacterium]
MTTKPGRNDPCYCGSGKKYKKCHLPADLAAEQEQRQWTDAARYLKEDLVAFAQDERFALPFAAALPFYWNNLYDLATAEEMSQFESLLFFDWFVFDYQDGQNPRLIELYGDEQRPELSSHQQQILDKWREVLPAAAYELVDYHGQELSLRDFVSGESYQVHEPAGRGQIERGDVILGRLLPVADRLEFSVSVAYLPKDEVADLGEKLAAARAADLETHPDAAYHDFMRRHNHLLVHHALAQAQQKGRPPVARLDPHRPDKALPASARMLKALKAAEEHAASFNVQTQTAARRVKHIPTKH